MTEQTLKNLNIIPEMRDENYKRMGRDEYFLTMCRLVAKRSHDSQTQCGCVLVKNDVILSTGVNGFVSGSPDELLPNLRPAKYPFVVHSEANAVINAAKNGIAISGATAYVTGPCCPECTKILAQAGVRDWVIGHNNHSTADKEKELCLFMREIYKINVRQVDF